MIKGLRIVFTCFVLIMCGICSSNGQAANNLQGNRLTGQWGGFRDKLEARGITFGSTFIGDGMVNLRGGLQQKLVLLDNWDIRASINTKRFLGWPGGIIHFSLLQNNGGQPSKFIGDVQTANNIEAVQTIRVYEAWIQQNIFNNRLSLLTGVYDINFEFDYMESASLFINSSQGLGGTLAASGLVGPSTFPTTTPTARIKVMPDPSFYIQVAVSNGVPGVEHVSWNSHANDGAFWIAETGLLKPMHGETISDNFYNRTHISRNVNADYKLKLAAGGWMYSRNFVAQRFGINVSPDNNDKGMYLIFDMRSFSWLNRKLDALSWHLQLGIADNQLSRLHTFWGVGLTYHRIPGDENGIAGFAVSAVQNSRVYKQQFADDQPDSEVALEWTYQTSITPWLNIQPDIQHIINPGMTPDVKDALVVGLRSEINL